MTNLKKKLTLKLKDINVEDFLISTVSSKLKATDIHHKLIESLLDLYKAKQNLSMEVLYPMMIDIFEYTLKILHSSDKHQKRQLKLLLPEKNKLKPDEMIIFLSAKFENAVKKSISCPEASQDPKTLHNYFHNFSETSIKDELITNHHIIDSDLLQGFIACRQKHGFFVDHFYEKYLQYKKLKEELNPEKMQEFTERWDSIYKLITQDMFELHKRKMNADSFDVLADLDATMRRLLHGGLFKKPDNDIDKLMKNFNQKLDSLFSDKYLNNAALKHVMN